MRGQVLGLILLAVAAAPATPAEKGLAPSIDQMLSFRRALGPRLSPDGRRVAYQVGETDWDENVFDTEIWLADGATGESFQLTRGKRSSTNPRWSPDGRRLAFVSDRDGKRQLYLISPAGGEPSVLTAAETGVSSFEWSPDGRRIAFTAAEPETEARKERVKRYGEIEVVAEALTFTRLWVIDVPAGDPEKPATPTCLTDAKPFTVGDFSWSPDSERLAFSAARDPDPESSDTQDLYVLRLADRSVTRIVATRGPDQNPVWSPDGKQIAFKTADGQEFFYYANSYLAVVPAEGGTPRVLSRGFDEEPSLIAWAPEGLCFAALRKTAAYLFRLDPATGAARRVSGPEGSVDGLFSFSRDFRTVAFLHFSPDRFPEVCLSPTAPFTPKPLTRMSDPLKEFRLGTREVIAWRSQDGTPIEGILTRPPDFEAGKKHPLLVIIHGGPTGVDQPVLRPDRYYPIQQFAAKGALILQPNYRGSAGYGAKFRALNVRNLGIGDYQDVISGVDHLIAQGHVDRDRVGAMGWSQGGYISAFITTYSDRFKAVSVGAGISDWMTYYVNTDIHPFTRQYLKATPWDDPEIYRKTSPISYLKTARTPTLILHGEFDRRVPIPNAYQLYQGLKDRGVPVKMVVYKGFGHGIDRPKQQRAVMEENYRWFSRWIWGKQPMPEGKGNG